MSKITREIMATNASSPRGHRPLRWPNGVR
jgi:hypothetical protein